MGRKFSASLVAAVLVLSGCSTLTLNPQTIADEIGEQQRREACLREYDFLCLEPENPSTERESRP